jgi:uncharacterized protein (TIGR02996 family)
VQILKHSDAQAFLASIRADDAEDTNRLVFADWLEEQGEAHLEGWAHLIRAQIEMARYWPYPEPPKELDQVNPAVRRAYWLAETKAKELLEQFQPAWLGYTPSKTKPHLSVGNPNKVKWRRGFPGLVAHDMKELRKYQSRPSWPLFTSLELQAVRTGTTRTSNDRSTLMNLLKTDQLNEVVFHASSSGHVMEWMTLLPELPNLRRVGFEMWDLGERWINLLTAPVNGANLKSFWFANPQMKIVLKPTSSFTTGGIKRLAEVFGQRCAVDTSKCFGGAVGARRW